MTSLLRSLALLVWYVLTFAVRTSAYVLLFAGLLLVNVGMFLLVHIWRGDARLYRIGR